MRLITLFAAVGFALVAVPGATAPALPVPAILMTALGDYQAGRFAAAWSEFRALADADSAIAETMLGTMYARGQGVRVNPATAAVYYYRAAQRGYAPAQLALARALAAGRGVAVDRDEAWIWARRAQQRGDSRVAEAAARVIAAVGVGRSVDERANLEARVAEWRPWPNGRE